MAEPDKRPVTLEELLVSSLAQTDALAKLLIEKGLITREEFMQKFPRNGRRIRSRTTKAIMTNTTVEMRDALAQEDKVQELHDFSFERSRGIVWVCDLCKIP